MSIPNISCEFNDSLHPLNLSFDSLIEVFLLNLREQQEVNGPRIRLTRVFGDERSERLIDVLSQEWGVGRLFNPSATKFICSNQNDHNVIRKRKLTIVLHKVNKVSNKVLRAATVSSSPSSPFNRFRLKRIYQFVNSSTRSKRRGTIVYNRYAAISSLTSLIND